MRTGVWLCCDLGLESLLNRTTTSWIQKTGGPKLNDGDQELTVARHIAGEMDGSVLLHLKSRSTESARRFFEQRQLSFSFDTFIPITARPSKRTRRFKTSAAGA
ncbi:MAG: hypothetical protein R2729_08260 [Bryobacteraceae bacterium]